MTMAAIALGTIFMVSPLGEVFRAGTSTRQARLFVVSQKGFVNEPLPLGISLNDASGGETVTLAGLAVGTGLSAGTPLSLSRWRLSSHEIAGALAYSPKDFVGAMDVGIDLHSNGDQLMDRQTVRLEWTQRTEDRSKPLPQPSKPVATMQALDADTLAVLEHFMKNGDIMSARILLKRAAGNGNAQAALELGMTFDPIFLAERGARGFPPDVAEARAWYERAMALGSSEASRNIERLTLMEK
jgi:TPR repeat protein